MSAQTYEDFLRGQAEKAQYGVVIIPARTALDIADFIEKKRTNGTDINVGSMISRQAAIDALTKHLQTTDVPASYPGIITALTEWLDALPSAQPDRKPGEWLMDGEKCGELMWRCSECEVSEAVPTATSFISGITYPQWKFCPNCGCQMERSTE